MNTNAPRPRVHARPLVVLLACLAIIPVTLAASPATLTCGVEPDLYYYGPTETDSQTPWLSATWQDYDGNHCPLEAWGAIIDGQNRPASAAGNNYDYYVWYNVPPPGLTPGSHSVILWMREVCCNSEGQRNYAQASWTLTVRDICGAAPLATSSVSPSGASGNAQPVIRATFTDLDRPCDLDTVTMLLDGESVTPSWTRSGGTYVVSYPVPAPLTPGQHTVQIAVTENGYFSNPGGATWSFSTVPDPGAQFAYADSVPGGAVTYTAQDISVERECGPFSLCVGPYAVPAPARATVTLDLTTTHADLYAGAPMQDYDLLDTSIPTPFGPLPLSLCMEAEDCVFPAPTTKGTVIDGSVTVVLDYNGERRQYVVPIHYAS